MRAAPATVAHLEIRRTVRTVAGNKTKLLLLAVVALFALGPITVIGLPVLLQLGEEAVAATVTAETADTVTGFVTGGTAIVWLFLAFMATLRTVTTVGDVDEPAFLLLSTPIRNTVVGVIAAEIVLTGTWVLPPAILFAAAFAYGAGTILPVLAAPLLIGCILVTAVPVAFVVGIGIRHLLTVYEPIARYRLVLFAAFWVAYFGAIVTGGFDAVMATLFTHLQASPLGWPGHLLLLGIPGIDASMLAVGGALAGAALLVACSIAVGVPAARVHWFADPARLEDEEVDAETSSDRLGDLLSGGVSRPTRTVTVTAIRRTRRAPIRLAYVGYPLLGTLGFVRQIVEQGTVPSYLAVLFCLYVVWAAGALFTLNPLGDFGSVLPAALTSSLTGRQAIRGRIIAGALVGVPVAIVAALALGLASPLSLEHAAALTAGTAVGAVAAPALATGVGSAFPRFGSVKVTNNREAVMPSKTAFLVYTASIALPAVAAVVLYLEAPGLIADIVAAASAWSPGPELSVSARTITVAAWTALGTGLIAPLVSYRYAVERFDWYALE